MGKPTGKKKAEVSKEKGTHLKPTKAKAFDEDTAIFINMSNELKEEGNKLFQKQDHEGAMLKYEKALQLLPSNHIDVANLRTNMAYCYMQMGIGEYPRAINECNVALEVAPKYSKALLRRARCFEALNRLDLAWRDVSLVLNMEANNQTALEMSHGLKKVMEEKGIKVDEIEIAMIPEQNGVSSRKNVKSKSSKKKRRSVRCEDSQSEHGEDEMEEDKLKPKQIEKQEVENISKPQLVEDISKPQLVEEDISKPQLVEDDTSKPEDKEVVQENIRVMEEKMVTKTVKLVLGDDIRVTELPPNCDVLLMRDVVCDRFPNLKGVLVKYRDQEGDLITITTTDELRKAEGFSTNSNGSLRLYISEVSPDQEPAYGGVEIREVSEVEKLGKDDVNCNDSTCIDSWIVQFAKIFKNHVGFESDSYLDLHGVGMKIYSEAIEDTVSSEDAQELFDIAFEKFQEMAAVALFNMGNVHMSKAKKQIPIPEDNSDESLVLQIKVAYEWAKGEYIKAGFQYEEALKMKPDFYEGHIALGQQQFEQAKLCWYYTHGTKGGDDMDPSATQEVLILYNKAEECMEKGLQMWEKMEERRLKGLSKEENDNAKLTSVMRSHIFILWGTLLYERSIVEFKLGLPSWEECLEVAVEKFGLTGASHTDITVMIKNHCSNQGAPAGLGFKIDEIVQAWHEMYDAKQWQIGAQTLRLEPLFRRRVPRLHHVLEHL